MKNAKQTVGHYTEAVPVRAADGIIRRTLLTGASIMLCEFRLEASARIPMHSHPHEQMGYVVSGRLRITVEHTTLELGPGDTYCAPANVPHGAEVLEAAVVVDSFSPPREDYRAAPGVKSL